MSSQWCASTTDLGGSSSSIHGIRSKIRGASPHVRVILGLLSQDSYLHVGTGRAGEIPWEAD